MPGGMAKQAKASRQKPRSPSRCSPRPRRAAPGQSSASRGSAGNRDVAGVPLSELHLGVDPAGEQLQEHHAEGVDVPLGARPEILEALGPTRWRRTTGCRRRQASGISPGGCLRCALTSCFRRGTPERRRSRPRSPTCGSMSVPDIWGRSDRLLAECIDRLLPKRRAGEQAVQAQVADECQPRAIRRKFDGFTFRAGPSSCG